MLFWFALLMDLYMLDSKGYYYYYYISINPKSNKLLNSETSSIVVRSLKSHVSADRY